MSCITDRIRRAFRSARGSILMEFVIVLPIYFILFGYVFLLGDLGLKTLQLATGDRDAAMEAGHWLGYAYRLFDSNQIVDSGLQAAKSMTLRADEDFKGAWSWQAAGTAEFTYRLPNWMSGFLVYPYLRYGSSSSDGALVTLAKGNVIQLVSKDRGNVRAYNYYTLKRTELSRNQSAYRNWSAAALVKPDGWTSQHWFTGVFDEPFACSDGARLDSDGPRQGSDELPTPKELKMYSRYDQFVKWSK